ncbi:putative myosin 15A, partial [Operophtera brumata]
MNLDNKTYTLPKRIRKFRDFLFAAPASNHILHTLIVPIVLWEVIFRKREKPHSHARYIQQMLGHMAVYMFYYTFYTEGIWLYPIFKVTYGTKYFFTLHLALAVLFFFYYYAQ